MKWSTIKFLIKFLVFDVFSVFFRCFFDELFFRRNEWSPAKQPSLASHTYAEMHFQLTFKKCKFFFFFFFLKKFQILQIISVETRVSVKLVKFHFILFYSFEKWILAIELKCILCSYFYVLDWLNSDFKMVNVMLLQLYLFKYKLKIV